MLYIYVLSHLGSFGLAANKPLQLCSIVKSLGYDL